MTQFSTAQFNKNSQDPSVKDLLDAHKRDIMLSFNCHAIAKITKFTAGDATHAPRVEAKINYKKSYVQPVSGTENSTVVRYETITKDYPLLVDCPVYILHGGAFKLTFPIAVGDDCSILFNDRDIDNWFASGQSVALASSRLHSMSDGIALIGLYSDLNGIPDYDTSHALLSNGDTKLGISAGKVLATNSAGKSLNDLLQDVCDNLNSLVDAFNNNASSLVLVTGAPSNPSPLNPAIVAALASVKSAVTTLSTDMGALLE